MSTNRNLLGLPRRVLSALRRNPEPFRALYGLWDAETPEERDRELSSLVGWIHKKRLTLESDRGLASAKGFAAELLEAPDLFVFPLYQIPHLGCLQGISDVEATRFDYVGLILRSLLRMKEEHPGFGLGSANFGVAYGGRQLTGLEIAQTLAVALNAGHLFGTFATERALLFELDSDVADQRSLLACVPDALRDWAAPILQDRNLYRFSYVLAAARLKSLPCSSDMREALISVFRLFDPTDSARNVDQLNWSFRRARQLAYQHIHALMRVGLAFHEDAYSAFAGQLRDSRVLGFDPDAEPPLIVSLLGSLDNLHAETVFSSPRAASLVLQHLREFRLWWHSAKQLGLSFETRLNALRARPADWPSEPRPSLRHYVRLRLPRAEPNWISEVRTWQGSSNRWSPRSSFLVTPAPMRFSGGSLLVDIYAERALDHDSKLQVARVLASKNMASWHNDDVEAARVVWRSVTLFGARLLQELFDPPLRVHVIPVAGDRNHVGYAMLCEGLEPGWSRQRTVANCLQDSARRAELIALSDLKKRRATADADTLIWLAFLGRVHLVDDDTNNSVAEIDGLWADFGPFAITWTALEHKSGTRDSRSRQLKRLKSYLNVTSSGIELAPVESGGRGSLVTFEQSGA